MWVFQAAGGFLFFTLVLLIGAGMYIGPIVVLLLILRSRIPPLAHRIVLAMAFAANSLFWMYRWDRGDIWRHGWHGWFSVQTLAFYAIYAATLAALGWLLGSLIAPKEKTPRGVPRGVGPIAYGLRPKA